MNQIRTLAGLVPARHATALTYDGPPGAVSDATLHLDDGTGVGCRYAEALADMREAVDASPEDWRVVRAR